MNVKKILEYDIQEKIYHSEHSEGYRARKLSDNQHYFIKIIKPDTQTLSNITRFKTEFNTLQAIEYNGILKYHEIIELNNNYAIVMEDFEGQPLYKFIDVLKNDLNLFLDVAIQITETLGQIHNNNIIHNNIKLSNILYNKKSGTTKITDFGLNKILNSNHSYTSKDEYTYSFYIYSSPEQSGRLDYPIDYRSDLYSLGITFYQILTGGVPFFSDDPMEIVHMHIAKKAVLPIHINPNIPLTISNIIIKLIAKTPEERYQNCFGLLADLKRCREELENKGHIPLFELARHDIPLKFSYPQLVVGRKNEIQKMLFHLNTATEGPKQIVFITGLPGVGKSTLVNVIKPSIFAQGSFLLTGKYKMHSQSIPYSALLEAFRQMILQILSETENKISCWKKKILETIGNNVQIIVDIIPELALIIGTQPKVVDPDVENTTNRFNIIFKNFIQIFSTKEHPLTIFLDDLHWIDSSSLQLLNLILKDDNITHLLFIGAYRENEVTGKHRLSKMLKKLDSAYVTYSKITLSSLHNREVNKLIAHFFHAEKRQCFPISEIIFNKTNGNPLFINQFLKKMYDEKIIQIDNTTGWTWNLKKANKLSVTENVAQIIEAKFHNLPEKTQDIIKLCSCIGSTFNAETVSSMLQLSIDEVILHLNICIIEGLISISASEYRFNHNRVLETIYSIIPREQKVDYHYLIGNYFISDHDTQVSDKKILVIVNHLNIAIDKYTNAKQKIELAKLNLQAAQKAKSASAYESAMVYTKTGRFLLEENDWNDHYTLCFTLHLESLELTFLQNRHNDIEKSINTIEPKVTNIFDLVKIYEIKIKSLMINNNLQLAIRNGIHILKKLKVHLPENPNSLIVCLSAVRNKLFFMFKNINRFLQLPTMADSTKLAATKMLLLLLTPIFISNYKQYEMIIHKLVKNIFKHGNISKSSIILALYGLHLIGKNTDIKSGYKFGQLALQFAKRSKDQFIIKETEYYVYQFINPYKNHILQSIEPILKYNKLTIELGNKIEEKYTANAYVWYMFFAGKNLSSIKNEVIKNKYSAFLLLQVIQNLIDEEISDPLQLNGKKYSEEKELIKYTANKDKTAICYYHFSKLFLAFMYQKYAYGINHARYFRKNIDAIKGHFIYPLFFFYESLCYLNITSEKTSFFQRKHNLKHVKQNYVKLKMWATHAPMNFLPHLLLLQAETARIQKQYNLAINKYELAIKEAHNNNFIHYEAIIDEQSARFHNEYGHTVIAQAYFQQALTNYFSWGATRKINQLESVYNDLLYNNNNISILSNKQKIKPIESLDLATIFKLSRAVASELNLNKLLITIITIAVENAGAQNGYLLLQNEENDDLYIYAQGSVDGVNTIEDKKPVDECDCLSLGIINYVKKTKEHIVLDNASQEGLFVHDQFITNNQTKSVLCSPILHKGTFFGLIYLENNLIKNAFTEDRLKLLRILLPQVAISIENLNLLEQRENAAKLQRELEIGVNIQSSLLPQEPVIQGYEIHSFVQPSEKVTGDYYDIINTPINDWIIIGDAAGHGINAGLIMMMVQTSIHVTLDQNPDLKPSQLLAMINKTITRNIQLLITNRYMTITIFSIDKNGLITYAGLHQHIFIYRKKTQTVEVIQTDGIWIGIIDEIENLLSDQSLRLEAGDTMLLYTDGITEAWRNDSVVGEREAITDMFGEKKLHHILETNGNKELLEIKNSVLNELKDFKVEDDMTLLLIRKKDEENI